MNCKTYKISDKITLSHIQTDKFKKARLTATFTVPIDPEQAPVNTMLVPTAMLGTELYGSFRNFCLRAEELYSADISDVNIKLGNYQIFGVHASMLNDAYISELDKKNAFSILDGVFLLISQIFLHPLFRVADTETEKNNLVKRIQALQNDAFGYAKHRFTQIMFKDEPCGYSLLGNIDDIGKINSDILKQTSKRIVNSVPMDFFYCGNDTPETVSDLIRKYFAEIIDIVPEANRISSVAKIPDSFTETEESGEYNQGNIFIGFRANTFLSDKEFYATELMNQIYGDGASSKLFRNVREKKSLCYFCASTYDEIRGVIVVGCGINNSDYDNAKNEILKQLENIKCGKITKKELASAREAILNDCRAAEDHPVDYEAFYRVYRLYGGPKSIEEYKQGILNVTKEDIISAANRMTLDTVYFLRGTLEGNYNYEE